jgi:hypothetical protein
LAKEVVMKQATNTVLSTEERRHYCLEAAERRSKPIGLSQYPKSPLSYLMLEYNLKNGSHIKRKPITSRSLKVFPSLSITNNTICYFLAIKT